MVNEQKILQIYSDDPQRGFKLLMDCYQEPVYYYVRRQLVSHDDAEDVTQEVFIRIFREAVTRYADDVKTGAFK